VAHGGDAFFVLSSGIYKVTATPLDAAGAESSVCTTATAVVTVTERETTETALAIFCGGGDTGGLDALVTVTQQPTIVDFSLSPTKFVTTCQQLTMGVHIANEGQSELGYYWEISARPKDGQAELYGLDKWATFRALHPGSYEVTVEVTTRTGDSTGLSVPIHVSGGSQAECNTLGQNQLLSETNEAPAFVPTTNAQIIRWRKVRLNPAVLLPPRNQFVDLALFPDARFRAVGIRVERNHRRRGYVWIGNLENQPRSLVVLSLQGNVLAGEVVTENGNVYEIRFAGNDVHIVRRINQATLPDGGPSTSVDLTTPTPEPDACGGTDMGDNIDVMVVYTQAVRNAEGNRAAAEALVYQTVATTNQAYFNSDVHQRIRLVHVQEVTHTEDPDLNNDLRSLRSSTDGAIDDIHTLRDTYGADIVSMIVNNVNPNYCGYGYRMATVSTDFENYAFSVVERSCSGSRLSFAHELGHNMGLHHDRYVESSSSYDYAFGYVNVGAKWRTIMAYDNECADAGVNCPRLPYFSNPNLTYGGDPMGVAQGTVDANGAAIGADSHLALNNTALTVANFRCSSPGVNDVWMRDTWDDTGAEPDPKTNAQSMWRSPYIWVRNAKDVNLIQQHRHENPIFGQPNWVYVKLHNGGDTAATGKLEVYYANASAGLTWPSNWTLLGDSAVNQFAAHSSQVVELNWPTLPGSGHYCLIARWVSESDPMTHAETAKIGTNVRNNNNIVWRNVNIVAGSPDQSEEVAFEVRPPDGDYDRMIIRLGPTADEMNGSFLIYGSASLRLDGPLFMAWRSGGMLGNGVELQEDNTILITNPAGGTLEIMAADMLAPGRVSIHIRRPRSTPARVFHLEATQHYRRDGREVQAGGVTYELVPGAVEDPV
jgi:hypothetical protein